MDVTYTCPLCPRAHIGSIYVTGPATSLQEFRQQAETVLRDPQTATHTLTQFTRLIHEQKGDFARLQRKFSLTGTPRRMDILDVNVTDESEYTCDGMLHQDLPHHRRPPPAPTQGPPDGLSPTPPLNAPAPPAHQTFHLTENT